jgi:hypothetical protein
VGGEASSLAGEAFKSAAWCAKKLAEPAAAVSVLILGLQVNAEHPDKGHGDAIRQRTNSIKPPMDLVGKYCKDAGGKAAAAAGAIQGGTMCITTIAASICESAPQKCCNGVYVGPGVSCGA